MEGYNYKKGDLAIIINHVGNHPYKPKEVVTILEKRDNLAWLVTNGIEESLVTDLDLFPKEY